MNPNGLLKMPGLKPTQRAWETVQQHLQQSEQKDVDAAERGRRLAELCNSDVWKLDVLPMLQAVWDRAFEKIRSKEAPIEALLPLEDFIDEIHSGLTTGFSSMARLLEKRAKLAEAPSSSPSNLPPLPPR